MRKLSNHIRCNSLADLTPDENHAIALQFLSLLHPIQQAFPAAQSISISPGITYSAQTTPSKPLNAHTPVFITFIELLTAMGHFLRVVLTTRQSSPQPPINSAVLVNVSDATPRPYVNQLLLLYQLIPSLLFHKGFETIRRHKNALSQFLLCAVHFIHHLASHACHADALSLAVGLLNTSLSTEHHAYLWRMCVIAGARLLNQSTLLTLIEAALKDPLGRHTPSLLCLVIGEHRIHLLQKYNKLAVPPFRFSVTKWRPLPYLIRFVNDTPLKGKPGEKNKYFNEANEVVTVEEVAGECYHTLFGYTARHEEGQSLRCSVPVCSWLGQLFVLLLWDCIFLPLPFAFQNDAQSKPIDYGTGCFYAARKPVIDALLDRIDALSDEEASEFVATSVANHRGLACPLDWRQVDAAWLQRLAFHLGGHRLAVICRRLASNLELFGSGLPDLTLLREETREDAMSHVLFVEVKGESDALSSRQSDWIQFFQENTVNFELCQVGGGGVCEP